MKPWSVEECESYAKQLRNKTRANTAEHAAQAIEYLLGLLKREWVGLTDEEIAEIEDGYIVDYRIPAGCGWNFAKDIEAKLREKNGG